MCVEAAKEAEAEQDDDMNGLQSDEEDDAEGMGDDVEDGDGDNNKTLERLAAQVCYIFSRFEKRNWDFLMLSFSKLIYDAYHSVNSIREILNTHRHLPPPRLGPLTSSQETNFYQFLFRIEIVLHFT